MKKGIVIIFGKNDFDITSTLNFKLFLDQKIKICLVNNGNQDKMLPLLNELSDSSKGDISILNLRKEKTTMLAVKAGVRFLSNIENLSLIVYANPTIIFTKGLIEKIIKTSNKDLIKRKDKRVLLRTVYSIQEVFNYKEKQTIVC